MPRAAPPRPPVGRSPTSSRSTTDDPWPSASHYSRRSRSTRGCWRGASTMPGSPRALEAAGAGRSGATGRGGPVVWAGSARLADPVRALFEPGAVTAVGNARPTPHREDGGDLRDHLQGLLRDTVAQEDQAHLSSATLPRAVSAIAAAGCPPRPRGRPGSPWRDPGAGGAGRLGRIRLHSSGGLTGIARVAGAAGRVARLAPEAGDEAAVGRSRADHERPSGDPAPERRGARGRAGRRSHRAGRHVRRRRVGPVDLLIGAGRTIAGAPRPAQVARMLLDGVRPVGVTQLAVDSASILGPLGSLPDGELARGPRAPRR